MNDTERTITQAVTTSILTVICTLTYQRIHHEHLVAQLAQQNLTCQMRGLHPSKATSSAEVINCVIIGNQNPKDDGQYLEFANFVNSTIKDDDFLTPSLLSDEGIETLLRMRSNNLKTT